MISWFEFIWFPIGQSGNVSHPFDGRRSENRAGAGFEALSEQPLITLLTYLTEIQNFFINHVKYLYWII